MASLSILLGQPPPLYIYIYAYPYTLIQTHTYKLRERGSEWNKIRVREIKREGGEEESETEKERNWVRNKNLVTKIFSKITSESKI